MKQKNGKFLILSGVLLLVSSIVTPYGVNALSAINATATSPTTAKSTNKVVNTSGLNELRVNNEGYSYTEVNMNEMPINGNFNKDTEEEGKMCDFDKDNLISSSDITRFKQNCDLTSQRDLKKCDLNKDGIFSSVDIVIFNDNCYDELLGNDKEENNDTFYFKTISIANPNNPSEGITIMDRNLGATSNDITSKNSFGYHYQWGNNYGFSQGCFSEGCSDNVSKTSVDVDVDGAIWNNSFNNSGFYGKKFIKQIPYYLSYWKDGDFYNGLWGGAGDNPNNNWGANQTNPDDRQGPCPNGYHIPSAGERGLLVKYWGDTYAQNELMNGGDGLYYLSGNDTESNFRRFFRIPYAGIRSYDNALLYNQGNYSEYWSSSPNGNAYSDEGMGESKIRIFSTYGIPVRNWTESNKGLSVRCFKDTYEPVASLSGLQTCVGMDSANVTHTINSGTITFKWDEIQGDFVDVAIYTNPERGYIQAGTQSTVRMKDKKFDYKIERSGKHKFMFRNGCNNFYYTVNISDKIENKVTDINISDKIENKVNNVNIDKKTQNKANNINTGYPTEMVEAYNFAYENGITTVSIDKSRMYSPLTRIQMAKMLSNYAIDVLGKNPDSEKGIIEFDDVTQKLDDQYSGAVTLSYQLGIMGINMKNNKFRPYDEVTRAEFATALSRLLYGDTYNVTNGKYYEKHLEALKRNGIMSITDDPSKIEKRGYVMTMLMRTAE